FEVVGRRAVIGAPVGIPEGPRVGLIDGGDDELDGGVGVVVAGDGVLAKKLSSWITLVVLDQVGVALAVGGDQPANDAQSGAFGVKVFARTDYRAVGDDALDIPFVRVKQKADERLLIVGISSSVCFNQKAKAVRGRSAHGQDQREHSGHCTVFSP